MSTYNLDESNELGWFGWSWPEKVVKNAKKYLLPVQGHMVTVRLVNNIHQRYLSLMSKGYGAIDFTTNIGNIKYRTWNTNTYGLLNSIRGTLNIELVYIDAVFRSLYELATNAEIPYSKLNPKQVISDDINNKIFKKNVFGNVAWSVGILGTIAVTGIVLQLRRDKK